MSEEATQETLNNETGDASAPGETLNPGESSVPMEAGDDLISTTEFKVHEPSDDPKDEKDPPGSTEKDGGEENKDGEDHDPVPYQRFQEKVHQTQELTDKLSDAEKRIAALEGELKGSTTTQKETPGNQNGHQADFINMAEKSDEDLLKWFDDKPLEFVSNLARQVIHETMLKVDQKLTAKERATSYQSKINEYTENHPEFKPMYESGKLNAYAEQNPGFDVFSAFMELTKDDREAAQKSDVQKRIDDALAAKEKELEEKYNQKIEEMQKNIKAKRELRTIGPGPGGGTIDTDKELQDTSLSGGVVATLADRLARRRRSAG